MDFSVSILKAGCAAVPLERRLDGIDVLHRLQTDATSVPRTLYWRKKRGQQTWWSVRDGDRKFVRRSDAGQWTEYLFDLSTDVAEERNLLEEQPEERVRLAKLLADWEADVAPPRP